ncbi:MAG TPA: hypothetical protein VG897_08405, partial [Terriglobales bacterium]|nr:hypothetical protein [Terriglobales bacterium]
NKRVMAVKREAATELPETGAILWMVAGRLTGLRPCEWFSAELIQRHPETGGLALLVQNAKAGGDRGNGDTRTIPLHSLDRVMTEAIRHHVSRCRQAAEERRFNTYYRKCSRALAAASRALWPSREKHYSLYSMRHQFSADAKSKLPAQEVAALLGHATDVTASRHYARAVRGSGSSFAPTPIPLAAEVQKVKLKKRPFKAGKTSPATSSELPKGRPRRRP